MKKKEHVEEPRQGGDQKEEARKTERKKGDELRDAAAWTGRTSFGVSLSQTNGLRLFGAVFHRNLLFIIRALALRSRPPDDIGPCLPGVALMSLIAPTPVRLPSSPPPAACTPGTSRLLSFILLFFFYTSTTRSGIYAR